MRSKQASITNTLGKLTTTVLATLAMLVATLGSGMLPADAYITTHGRGFRTYGNGPLGGIHNAGAYEVNAPGAANLVGWCVQGNEPSPGNQDYVPIEIRNVTNLTNPAELRKAIFGSLVSFRFGNNADLTAEPANVLAAFAALAHYAADDGTWNTAQPVSELFYLDTSTTELMRDLWARGEEVVGPWTVDADFVNINQDVVAGTATATARVTIENALGQPVPNVWMFAELIDGNGNVLNSVNTLTDANGQVQFAAGSTVARDGDNGVTLRAWANSPSPIWSIYEDSGGTQQALYAPVDTVTSIRRGNDTLVASQVNIEEPAVVEVQKAATTPGVSVANVQFELRDAGGNVVATGTTDASGFARLTIPPTETSVIRNYTLHEVSAPSPLILDTTPIPIQFAANDTYEFRNVTNDVEESTVVINKTDSSNGASLAGAVFEIRWDTDFTLQNGYEESTQVTTGANGRTPAVTIPGGARFTWREVTAPVGFTNGNSTWFTPAVVSTPGQQTLVNVENDRGPLTISTQVVETELELLGGSAQIQDRVFVNGLFGSQDASITLDLFGPFSSQEDLDSAVAAGNLTPSQTASFSVTADGNITASDTFLSPDFTIADPGYWTFAESITAAEDGRTASNPAGAASETFVALPELVIATQVEASEIVLDAAGTATITDTILVDGLLDSQEGTVTLDLYGPFESNAAMDAAIAAGGLTPLATEFITVNGDNDTSATDEFVSPEFTVTQPGIYTFAESIFVADDSRTDSNPPGAVSETFAALPYLEISTQVQESQIIIEQGAGANIFDDVTVGGLLADQEGTVTLDLYGPFESNAAMDAAIAAGGLAPLATQTFTVTGDSDIEADDTFTSPAFGVSTAGIYTFAESIEVAEGTVTREASNAQGAPSETFMVMHPLAIATQVTTSEVSLSPVGGEMVGTITDQIMVDGLLAGASGTVTLSLYGPFETQAEIDAAAALGEENGLAPIETAEFTVTGDDDPTTQDIFISPEFTVDEAGLYTFAESIVVDLPDGRSAHNQLGAPSETFRGLNDLDIATQVTDAIVMIGANGEGTITDRVMVDGLLANGEAAITLELYGPYPTAAALDEAANSGTATPADSITFQVTADSDKLSTDEFTSPPFTVTEPGYYNFAESIVSAEDSRTAANPMGAPSETFVAMEELTISTQVTESSVDVTGGTGTIIDEVFVSGLLADSSATITLELYGPYETREALAAAAAAGVDNPAMTTTFEVTADGNAAEPDSFLSPEFTVTEEGYYTFAESIATASDDRTASNSMGAPSETFVATVEIDVSTQVTSQRVTLTDNGATITDQIIVDGLLVGESATVTLDLYGPYSSQAALDAAVSSNDSAPAQSVSFAVVGDNDSQSTDRFVSPPFAVTEAGYYTFAETIVSSVDGRTSSNPMGAPSETFTASETIDIWTRVTSQTVAISAAGSGSITDEVNVSGLLGQQVAEVTLELYGPYGSLDAALAAADTTASPITVLTFSVTGDADPTNVDTFISPEFTVSQAGYYTFAESVSVLDGRSASNERGAPSETFFADSTSSGGGTSDLGGGQDGSGLTEQTGGVIPNTGAALLLGGWLLVAVAVVGWKVTSGRRPTA